MEDIKCNKNPNLWTKNAYSHYIPAKIINRVSLGKLAVNFRDEELNPTGIQEKRSDHGGGGWYGEWKRQPENDLIQDPPLMLRQWNDIFNTVEGKSMNEEFYTSQSSLQLN